jgi:glycosyltransferase involved in cell wall biosynthesis
MILPSVSVIIPFYDDHSCLPDCLSSLSQQTYPAANYEVIVVDNSADAPPLQVPSFPSVRVHQERHPGSYAARNRGIAMAANEILAFIDADCIAKADWIEKGVAQLKSVGAPAVVSGRVEFTYRKAGAPNLFELYDAITSFRQHTYVNKDHFGGAGNLFTPKCVFEEVGLFDGALKSAGDWEWGQRVHARKIPQLYADDVVVSHPARTSLRDLASKHMSVAGGRADIDRATPHRRVGIHRELLYELRTAYWNWSLMGEFPAASGRRARLGAVLSVLTVARTLERVRLRLGGTSRR